MLDGRIDTQGTIVDLKAQGILDDIKHDAETEDDTKVEETTAPLGEATVDDAPQKVPRKLVEEEHRETGGVKWHVYDVYLRAWCVEPIVLSDCSSS